MLEPSNEVQTEMKKLQEELNAAFRGMCRRSPPLFISSDLQAAM